MSRNSTWEELAGKIATFVGMDPQPEVKLDPAGKPHRVHLHFRTKNLFNLATISIFRVLDSDGLYWWKVAGSRDGVQDHMAHLQNLNGD